MMGVEKAVGVEMGDSDCAGIAAILGEAIWEDGELQVCWEAIRGSQARVE
jgi:hypothetical protein